MIVWQQGTALPQRTEIIFPNNNNNNRVQDGRVCVRYDSPGAGKYREGFPRGPELQCPSGYVTGIEYSG